MPALQCVTLAAMGPRGGNAEALVGAEPKAEPRTALT